MWGSAALSLEARLVCSNSIRSWTGLVGIMSLHVCHFFFFQAEDGIRDKLVTGVQTCALPICRQVTVNALALGLVSTDMAGALDESYRAKLLDQIPLGRFAEPDEVARIVCFMLRSEEGRGGEEGRSRWVADSLKKKKRR